LRKDREREQENQERVFHVARILHRRNEEIEFRGYVVVELPPRSTRSVPEVAPCGSVTLPVGYNLQPEAGSIRSFRSAILPSL
jgi:hypothetical protein